MLAQARRVHSWAPNIAVKLPATAAGIEVIEHLAEEGIPICATINVSVAQAIAVAEAYARGKEKAIANGVKPPLCIVVQQVGRLDDYLRDVAQDMKLGLDESVITMAGLAVAKRTYHILQEMKSDAIIMPAGLRGAYHLTEMAGGRLLYTINTRVQDMILEADPPQVEKIAEPIPAETLSQLQRIPEFGPGLRAGRHEALRVHYLRRYPETAQPVYGDRLVPAGDVHVQEENQPLDLTFSPASGGTRKIKGFPNRATVCNQHYFRRTKK